MPPKRQQSLLNLLSNGLLRDLDGSWYLIVQMGIIKHLKSSFHQGMEEIS